MIYQRLYTTVLLTHAIGCLSAQNLDFQDVIERTNGNGFKFFIGDTFKAKSKACASHYLTVNLDGDRFQMEDTARVYRMNGELRSQFRFEGGRLYGEYIDYHNNGNIRVKGFYMNNSRVGKWEYFYRSGDKYKTVLYDNGLEYLSDLFKKNGRQVIKNGTGKVKDKVRISLVNNAESEMIGSVTKGLRDGEWIIRRDGFIVGTEFFKNGVFIKGVSHSVLGDTEYNDYYLSSFTDLNHVEHISFVDPGLCNGKTSISPRKGFYERIRELSKSIAPLMPKDCWFLVEIKTDESDKIVDLRIMSNQEEKLEHLLKETLDKVLEVKRYKGTMVFPTSHFLHFPVVFQNGGVYLPEDQEADLFSLSK